MTTIEICNKFLEEWNKEAHNEDYVVCLCAKDENDYLIEWIRYYLNIGFNKIVIADNNNDNSLEELLQGYIDCNAVYLVDCRNMKLFQEDFYTVFCRNNNFRWCAFFDTDEFLEVYYSNIRCLFENIAEDVVCFNWLMYDCNGEMSKRDGDVQERFPMPVFPIAITKENMMIKSVVRGGLGEKVANLKFNGSHIPYTEEGLTYNIGGAIFKGANAQNFFPIRYKNGYLKHYYTKSYEEWNRKYDRGWPGHGNMAIDDFNVMNTISIPVRNYSRALFCDNNDKIMDKDSIEHFKVMMIRYDNSPYAFIRGINVLMEQCENHLFIIVDNIDDTMFAQCLESAFKTNNKLVFCHTEYFLGDILNRYNEGRTDNIISIGMS